MKFPPLGRKHKNTEEQWQYIRQNALQYVSVDALHDLTERTLADIAEKTKGLNCAIGWSGGKDSLVLEHLTSQAGIKQGVSVMSNLEFSEFREWFNRSKPDYIEVIERTFDLQWLVDSPDYLFPPNSKILSRWYSQHQNQSQRDYAVDRGIDVMIYGRRRDDNNFTGNGANFYTSKRGTVYNPISDWSHEHLLAYLKFHNIELPPTYSWPRGFAQGPGPWAWRNRLETIMHSWNEIYHIDFEIVHNASMIIPSASEYLVRRGNGETWELPT